MEEIRYVPDELPYTLLFLKDLSEEQLDNKKAPLLLAGTVTQIVKSNENMCVFFIEDCTMGHVAEYFRNKLSPFTKVNKGDMVEIKAFYCKNKYGEKILRIFKLRKITMDEEYLHYMEILVGQKRAGDALFNEQGVIEAANKEATDVFIKVVPREDILRRKIFSYVFMHCLKDWHSYIELNGYISRTELVDISEISVIRSKMEDNEKFNALLDDVCRLMENSRVLMRYENGFIMNLKFFEHFEANFFDKLKVYYESQVSFSNIYALFNNMLEENNDFYINKEVVYEFISGLIFKKRLYFIDEKKQLFGVIHN